jgi:hypothetical protein
MRRPGSWSVSTHRSMCLGIRLGATQQVVEILPRQKLPVHDDRPAAG